MHKILAIVITLIPIFFGNISLFSNYKPLSNEQIRNCIGSDSRNIFSLQGDWIKNGSEKVTIPYTEYNTSKTEYTRTISLDSFTLGNKSISLYFLGLAGNSELYINDEFLTKIDGETISHNILVPNNLLNVGSNSIKLVFLGMSEYSKKNIHSSIESPHPFIGIFREPFLVVSSKTFVKSINQVKENNQIKISIDIQSVESDLQTDAIPNKKQNNDYDSYRVEWILKKTTDDNTSVLNSYVISKVQNGRITNIDFSFSENILERWSPKNPNLYVLTIKVKKGETLVDDYSIYIANKTLTTKGKSILLNKQPIKLLCMEYDEYFPGCGYTRSIKSLEQDVLKLKLLEVNTLLFNYVNPSPILMDLCAKYGIFVLINHTSPSIELKKLEDINYVNNSLENKLNNYSSNPVLIAVGSKDQGAIKRILKKQLLAFDISKVDAKKTNSEDISFYIYDIDYDVNKNNKDELINKLNAEENPVLLLVKALYKGERLQEDKSTIYNRQSIRHKELFGVYKETNIAGYIVEGFRDRKLMYPNYNGFNDNVYRMRKGLIGDNNVERPVFNMIKQLYLGEKSSLLNVSNLKIDYSIFYLVMSIIIVLLLSYMLKRDNKLYTLFQRSILRGHNLYCDIRDERLSYSLPIYALLILEIMIIALSVSIFVTYSLHSSNFSYFLSLTLSKEVLNLFTDILYSEILLLLFNFLLYCFFTLILILFLRLIFLLFRIRSSFSKTYYLIVFLYSPFVVLSVISVFLGRLLILSDVTSVIFVLLFILLVILLIKRIIESTAILLDKRTSFTAIIMLLSLSIFIFLPTYLYFNHIQTIPFILKLMFN